MSMPYVSDKTIQMSLSNHVFWINLSAGGSWYDSLKECHPQFYDHKDWWEQGLKGCRIVIGKCDGNTTPLCKLSFLKSGLGTSQDGKIWSHLDVYPPLQTYAHDRFKI